jgi:amidase
MIKEGSTIYLPVAVTGAMLAMGDLHALMGDGEVLICGVEITGEVDVKLQLIKQAHYPLPLLKTPDKWYAIASAQTLDQAADMATRQMADILTKINQVSNEDAGMLMSIAGHLEVCQVVDPLKTARFSMPVSILSSLGVRMPGDK